jgi:hypothetical protein
MYIGNPGHGNDAAASKVHALLMKDGMAVVECNVVACCCCN